MNNSSFSYHVKLKFLVSYREYSLQNLRNSILWSYTITDFNISLNRSLPTPF